MVFTNINRRLQVAVCSVVSRLTGLAGQTVTNTIALVITILTGLATMQRRFNRECAIFMRGAYWVRAICIWAVCCAVLRAVESTWQITAFVSNIEPYDNGQETLSFERNQSIEKVTITTTKDEILYVNLNQQISFQNVNQLNQKNQKMKLKCQTSFQIMSQTNQVMKKEKHSVHTNVNLKYELMINKQNQIKIQTTNQIGLLRMIAIIATAVCVANILLFGFLCIVQGYHYFCCDFLIAVLQIITKNSIFQSEKAAFEPLLSGLILLQTNHKYKYKFGKNENNIEYKITNLRDQTYLQTLYSFKTWSHLLINIKFFIIIIGWTNKKMELTVDMTYLRQRRIQYFETIIMHTGLNYKWANFAVGMTSRPQLTIQFMQTIITVIGWSCKKTKLTVKKLQNQLTFQWYYITLLAMAAVVFCCIYFACYLLRCVALFARPKKKVTVLAVVGSIKWVGDTIQPCLYIIIINSKHYLKWNQSKQFKIKMDLKLLFFINILNCTCWFELRKEEFKRLIYNVNSHSRLIERSQSFLFILFY